MNHFLFVDRLLELTPGKYARGVKHITPHDRFIVREPYTKKPVISSCIIGEAVGQTSAWAVMKANNFKSRPVAGMANEVSILGRARVGDTVILEATIDALTEESVHYNALATVNGKPILRIENALGPILPMEDFISPEIAEQQFNTIYRPGDAPEPFASEQCIATDSVAPYIVNFDHVVEWEKGKHIKARKNISNNHPYFADHFPRKPVLPLTLLLECKIKLTHLFLEDMLGEEDASQFQLHSFRKIKMTRFVQPGDSIFTTVMLGEQQENEITFRYRTELEGKRICLAQSIFRRVGHD